MTASAAPDSRRALALDALRGLALFGMALSGMIPFGGVHDRHLPDWMYHAQIPPPAYKLDTTRYGLTWVDLVFPFFLFALGAALPLAQARYAESGAMGKIWGRGVVRYLALAMFAYVVEQTKLGRLQQPGQPYTVPQLLTCLGLFALIALAWGRWPRGLPAWVNPISQGVGVLGLAAVIWLYPWPGGPFGFARVDVILLVLANMAFFGTVFAWACRNHPAWLWGLTLAVMVLFTMVAEGWAFGPQLGAWTPLKELYQFSYFKYLAIVLPGVWAGSFYLQTTHREPLDGWGVVAVGLGLPTIAWVLLLDGRDWSKTVLAILALGGIAYAHSLPSDGRIRAWLRTGCICVLVGLMCLPQGGGIRKDWATLSYFPMTAGLSLLTLAGLESLATMRPAWVRPLALAGMNAMLGYIAITHLVPAFIRITKLHDGIGWVVWDTPLRAQGLETMTVYGFAQAALVIAVAALGTRFQWFMRS